MSRLQKHYQKQLRRRLIIAGGVFIFLVLFFGTTGLGLLINSSSYIGSLFGKRAGDDRGNILIQDIHIDELPPATSTPEIEVSGSAINFEKVEFFLSGKMVEKADLSETGEFDEKIGPLTSGENEIYIIAHSKNTIKRSESYTISFLKEKPKLEITEPADGATTSSQEIKVAGKTGEDIEVKVNDQPVVTDSQGVFQTLVKLQEGENKIKIIATDIAGNTEEKILMTKYEKP